MIVRLACSIRARSRASTRRTRRSRCCGPASTGSTCRATGRRRRSSCARARRRRPSPTACSRCCPARRQRCSATRTCRPTCATARASTVSTPGAPIATATTSEPQRGVRVAADGRLRGPRPVRGWETYPEYGAVWFPTTVAAGWAPYRYGRWVVAVRLGYLGRRRAVGLRAVPLRPLGVHRRTLGLVPRRATSRARCGRRRWSAGTAVGGGRGRRLRPGLRLGPARLGRSVHPALAQLLEPLLEQLQPAVRGERRRASAAAADALRQLPVPGAVTAMSGAAFVSGKPVAINRVNLPSGQLSGLPPLSNAPEVKPLPIRTNRVRPGNGAPIPASHAPAARRSRWRCRRSARPPPRPARRCSRGPDRRRPTTRQNRRRRATLRPRAERRRKTPPKGRSAPGPLRRRVRRARKQAADRDRCRSGRGNVPPQNPNGALPGRTRAPPEVAANRGGPPSAPRADGAPRGRAGAAPPQPAMSAPPASCAPRRRSPQPAMSARRPRTCAAGPQPQPAMSAPPRAGASRAHRNRCKSRRPRDARAATAAACEIPRHLRRCGPARRRDRRQGARRRRRSRAAAAASPGMSPRAASAPPAPTRAAGARATRAADKPAVAKPALSADVRTDAACVSRRRRAAARSCPARLRAP